MVNSEANLTRTVTGTFPRCLSFSSLVVLELCSVQVLKMSNQLRAITCFGMKVELCFCALLYLNALYLCAKFHSIFLSFVILHTRKWDQADIQTEEQMVRLLYTSLLVHKNTQKQDIHTCLLINSNILQVIFVGITNNCVMEIN